MNLILRTLLAVLFLCCNLAPQAQIITTIAGTPTVSGFSGAGGPATAAQLSYLDAVSIDKAGNIYTSDNGNHVIWKIDNTGIISLYAGTGIAGYTGDGAAASAAQLDAPTALSVDNLGNLYVIDQNGACVRRIDAAGIITTIARNTHTGAPPTGDGGPLLAATFNGISGFVPDNAGNFYISDLFADNIRKVNSAGIVSTVVGTGVRGFSGDGGPATAAELNSPQQVAFDNDGNLYIPDEENFRIRKIDAAGIITTVAGSGRLGYSGNGGPATNATFFACWQVAFDACNNMYIADPAANSIRKVDRSGIISTYAGMGYATYGYSGDGGPADQARITGALSIAFDNSNNMYIADEENFIVRKVASPPPAQITMQPAGDSICYGANATFSVTATDATSYQWQTNSGSGWTNLADDATYSGTTTDLLTITAAMANLNTTQYRCLIGNACDPASTPAVLTVNTSPTPEVSIVASQDAICAGTTVNFTANATNTGSQPAYQWQVDGQDVGTDTPAYTTANLKDQDFVTCVLTSSLTCTSPVASQNQVTMTVNAKPTIATIPDTIIAPGGSVVLLTNVTGPVTSYQWTPATGLDNPNSASPTATPENMTTYQVVATTDAGCTASGKLTIGIARTLRMPGAFTPNGDGNNDLFRIPPSSPVKLTDFAVYNRWGSRVFYSTGSATGWDGTCGGREQPAGTYVWIIDYKDPVTSRPAEATGTVILIR